MNNLMPIKTLMTRASTITVTALMAIVAYWMQLAPAEQAALIASYPWLKVVTPLFGWVAFVVARMWPQAPQEPKE